MSYRNRLLLGRPSGRETYAVMTPHERFFFWLAIVNFCVFVAIALALGGDAINGTVRDGHYYLMEHGVYTEVSKPVFTYSAIHTLSLFITHPLGIAVGFRASSRARKLPD